MSKRDEKGSDNSIENKSSTALLTEQDLPYLRLILLIYNIFDLQVHEVELNKQILLIYENLSKETSLKIPVQEITTLLDLFKRTSGILVACWDQVISLNEERGNHIDMFHLKIIGGRIIERTTALYTELRDRYDKEFFVCYLAYLEEIVSMAPKLSFLPKTFILQAKIDFAFASGELNVNLEKAVEFFKEYVNSPLKKSKTVQQEALVILLKYYFVYKLHVSNEFFEEAVHFANLLEKEHNLLPKNYYLLGNFYYLVSKYENQAYLIKAKTYLEKALECKLDQSKTEFQQEYDSTILRLGYIYYYGIKDVLPSNITNAISCLSKASNKTKEGKSAQKMLISLKIIGQILNETQDSKDNSTILSRLGLIPDMSRGYYAYFKFKKYLENLTNIILSRTNFPLALSCLLNFYFNRPEYSQVVLPLVDEFSKLCIKTILVSYSSENYTYYFPLLQLIEKNKAFGYKNPEAYLSGLGTTEDKEMNIKNYKNICAQLAEINRNKPDFCYQLKENISHLNTLLFDLALNLKRKPEFCHGKSGTRFLIDLCNLSISAENLSLKKILDNYSNFKLQDIDLLINLTYHFAAVGYTIPIEVCKEIIKKDLDSGQQRLLFCSLYLSHTCLRTDDKNGPEIMDLAILLANKLNPTDFDITTANAFEYFSHFEKFRKHLPILEYKFCQPKSTMRTTILQCLRVLCADDLIEDYLLENKSAAKSTMQVDAFLQERKIIVHIYDLNNFLMRDEKGSLEPSPKIIGRNKICSNLDYKQINITADDFQACEKSNIDQIIFYFNLLQKKMKSFCRDFSLKHFNLPKPQGDRQRLLPGSPKKQMSVDLLISQITELLVSIKEQANPDMVEAYQNFFEQAQQDKNEAALCYLLQKIEVQAKLYQPTSISQSKAIEFSAPGL